MRQWTLYYAAAQASTGVLYPRPEFTGPEITEDTKVVEKSHADQREAELVAVIKDMSKQFTRISKLEDNHGDITITFSQYTCAQIAKDILATVNERLKKLGIE